MRVVSAMETSLYNGRKPANQNQPRGESGRPAGSTRFAKLRGQVGFLGSFPTETPALERDVVRIEAPVKVLLGEYDTLVSVTNSQRLADLLPNSRFALIPGAAH